MDIHGRTAEGTALATVLDGVRAARSGVLVLRGPAGIGKTALLDATVRDADDMCVLRARGVESEAALPFAALHQLLRPVQNRVECLPAHQARALRVALGQEQAADQDSGGARFLVAVAVLGLLGDVAEESPVLCVVDDAHWLDHASAATLLFVARRLAVERVGMIVAAREGRLAGLETEGLPELTVGGLDVAAAAALLRERVTGPVDPAVCEQLVRWTAGNPLALVELPALLTPDEFAGREPLPVPLPVTEGVERVYAERAGRLPASGRAVLLLAAADGTGRVAAVLRAAALRGVDRGGLDSAESAGLLSVHGSHLAFSHPLVRSAVYQSASTEQRCQAHRTLAQVETDPDRRAWHRAAAAIGPDESTAGELEALAARAGDRGGSQEASSALERAADLSADPTTRCRRLIAAAENAWLVGRFGRVSQLVQAARPLAAEPLLRAAIGRQRGWVELSVGSPAAAHRILVGAARSAAPVDARLARALLAAAAESAWLTGDREAGAELASSAAVLPSPEGVADRVSADHLAGFLAFLAGDVAAAVRLLTGTIAVAERTRDEGLLGLAAHHAFYVGDDEAALRLNTGVVARARAAGAVVEVLFALPRLVQAQLLHGHWTTAAAGAAEAVRLAGECGQGELAALPLAWLALLAAQRGEDETFWSATADATAILGTSSLGVFAAPVSEVLQWARAMQKGTTSRPASADGLLAALVHPVVAEMATLDLVEAAVRSGRRAGVRARLERLEATAAGTRAPWARARVAHCQGLLSDGAVAAERFEEALDHHEQAHRPFERARTELACGEALRRLRRRVDARPHLEAALDAFDRLGAAPWVERAGAELRASGRTARRRDPSTLLQLTPQELQVAHFVAGGLPTREVAAQLFLSPRTVEFHLHNVFTKLRISSRTELAALRVD